jgi:hypothetical protein
MLNSCFYFKVSWKGVVWIQVNSRSPTETCLAVLGRSGLFMLYVTKLSVAATTQCRMQGRMVGRELERM